MNQNYILWAVITIAVFALSGFVIFSNQKASITSGIPDGESSTEVTSDDTPIATPSLTLSSTSTPMPAVEVVEDVQPVSQTPATPPVQIISEPTPAPTVQPSGITLSEVSNHDSKESCWTVVSGSVYDLTSFISKHPGGSGRIVSMCGRDSTQAFLGQHKGDRKPEALLSTYKIDTLAQ